MMRRGAKAGTSTVVVAVLLRSQTSPQVQVPQSGSDVAWRCGFIVSKAVGNAVTRHRTTRRLRHIVAELISADTIELPEQRRTDIVVRALTESAHADHGLLTADVSSGLRRALAKAQKAQAHGPR